MTENVKGYNTALGMGAATGTLPGYTLDTYSRVLDIEEMTLPSPSKETEEWTVLDMKASKKMVGSISYSALSATLTRAFGDSVHDQIKNDANAGVTPLRNWRVQMPDLGSETMYFTGYVSKFETSSITNDARVKVGIEIVVDGEVTYV